MYLWQFLIFTITDVTEMLPRFRLHSYIACVQYDCIGMVLSGRTFCPDFFA